MNIMGGNAKCGKVVELEKEITAFLPPRQLAERVHAVLFIIKGTDPKLLNNTYKEAFKSMRQILLPLGESNITLPLSTGAGLFLKTDLLDRLLPKTQRNIASDCGYT